MKTCKLSLVERLVCSYCSALWQANTNQHAAAILLALCSNRFTVQLKLVIPCRELSFITVTLYLSYEMLKATTVFHFVSFYFLLFKRPLLMI